jgi:hypothetical protein
MKAIRIATAIGVTTALILLYPYYHTMLDTLTDLATAMFPGMTTMDSFFLQALPVAVLGVMIWGGIQLAIGKLQGGDIE